MKKINILVLGVGGNVGQGIIKALMESSIEYRLVTACVSSASAGLYVGESAYISPYADSYKFIPWLIEVCNSEKIDIILTGVEEIIESLVKNQAYIGTQSSVKVIVPYKWQLDVGNDKLSTCQWLEQKGLNYPGYAAVENKAAVRNLISRHSFPLIAKPRKGKGSAGIKILYDEQDLKNIINLRDYVIEEMIGNEAGEYTVGCYGNSRGKISGIIILHRMLKNGTTMQATVVDNDKIYEQALKICSIFQPRGPLNLQFRIRDNSDPVCFEMNVRFSGTTPIRSHFGFNDVEAMIRDYLFNENVDRCFNIKYGTAFRYLTELYVDNTVINDLRNNKKIENLSYYGFKD